MSGVLAGFGTIWVVTAAGWLVGRLGLLGARAERVLARLVFFVLTPALLFTTLAASDPARLLTPALAAFAAGAAGVALAGAALAGLRPGQGRRSGPETVVAGLCASYVNAANLGIPVAAYVLGDVAAVTPVLLFQVLFVAPAALAVLDAGTRDGPRPGLRRLVLLPARNPIMLGSAAGIALALTGWQPPALVLRPFELVGSAAVPVALLALGLALAGERPRPGPGSELASPAGRPIRPRPGPRSELASPAGRPIQPRWGGDAGLRYALVGLKTVGHPLLAYAVARYALGLTGPALFAAVVTAALPTAQNVFVFAARYERAEPLARDVVLLSTLVAAVTMAGVAALLG